jgi:hypothetical protein
MQEKLSRDNRKHEPSIGMDNSSANVLIRPGRQRRRIMMSLMSTRGVVSCLGRLRCAPGRLFAGFRPAVESAVLAQKKFLLKL